MGIPDYNKEDTLLICIEHDHGQKAKKGDFRMMYHRVAAIYIKKRREQSQTVKWRKATPFEAEAYHNGVKNIRIIK